MENIFRIEGNIHLLRDTVPIRFFHHKSIDKPENHVLHLNNYVEIYIYISGNHHYMVENRLYELTRGDIIVINPREVHKALPLCETEYERFYFLVEPNTLRGMEPDPLQRILKKPSQAGNRIALDPEKRKELLQLLQELSQCFQDGREESLRAFSCFLLILDEIDRHLQAGAPSEGDPARTPTLLKRILLYIAEHTKELQSVTELAEALGLSPQYLSAYFSKQLETPLKTYICAKKIALAKELLDNGATINWACYECGFNDCSYFIKVFKKYVGKTPMAYKKERSHPLQK